MEAAAARLRPHAPPYSGPSFLTWYGGDGSRENLVASLPELGVCNDLRAVLCSLPGLGPAPKSASYREIHRHPPPRLHWAGLGQEAPPLSAYAGGRERKWDSPADRRALTLPSLGRPIGNVLWEGLRGDGIP